MLQQQQLLQSQLAELQYRERAARLASIDIEAELKKRINSNPETMNFIKKFIEAIKVTAEAGGDPAAITTSDDAAYAVISMAKVAMKAAIEIANDKGIAASQLKGWLYSVAERNKFNDLQVLEKMWGFLTK